MTQYIDFKINTSSRPKFVFHHGGVLPGIGNQNRDCQPKFNKFDEGFRKHIKISQCFLTDVLAMNFCVNN